MTKGKKKPPQPKQRSSASASLPGRPRSSLKPPPTTKPATRTTSITPVQQKLDFGPSNTARSMTQTNPDANAISPPSPTPTPYSDAVQGTPEK